jgi:hypothetical protein
VSELIVEIGIEYRYCNLDAMVGNFEFEKNDDWPKKLVVVKKSRDHGAVHHYSNICGQ